MGCIMNFSPKRITNVDVTNDVITGRGGLTLFNRYMDAVGIFPILEKNFGSLRKSLKMLPISCLFGQTFNWLYDGTSKNISYFDLLKEDEGYAAALELPFALLASSHMIKRFFRKFNLSHPNKFRKILKDLFIWRLRVEAPSVINLTIDTMVMDNDEAQKREGVSATYKKKKGFQPLQIIWNGRLVDAIFRGGKKSGNHGKTVINMLTDLIALIRNNYNEDVPIIVRLDGGFFDLDNFAALDALDVGFIASGKMFGAIHEYVACSNITWDTYEKGKTAWKYTEFGQRCESWPIFYRTFYTRPYREDKQLLLEFARPENVILTNLGVNQNIFSEEQRQLAEHYESAQTIIEGHHQRGADELPHRGFKDFGFEQLPFQNFFQNSAMYYCMAISFFLFESFKRDVLCEVVPITHYATTIRRKIVDFAAKITKTARRYTLKVSKAIMKSYRIDILWKKCQNPPPIVI